MVSRFIQLGLGRDSLRFQKGREYEFHERNRRAPRSRVEYAENRHFDSPRGMGCDPVRNRIVVRRSRERRRRVSACTCCRNQHWGRIRRDTARRRSMHNKSAALVVVLIAALTSCGTAPHALIDLAGKQAESAALAATVTSGAESIVDLAGEVSREVVGTTAQASSSK